MSVAYTAVFKRFDMNGRRVVLSQTMRDLDCAVNGVVVMHVAAEKSKNDDRC